jgi:hypothetical protein
VLRPAGTAPTSGDSQSATSDHEHAAYQAKIGAPADALRPSPRARVLAARGRRVRANAATQQCAHARTRSTDLTRISATDCQETTSPVNLHQHRRTAVRPVARDAAERSSSTPSHAAALRYRSCAALGDPACAAAVSNELARASTLHMLA